MYDPRCAESRISTKTGESIQGKVRFCLMFLLMSCGEVPEWQIQDFFSYPRSPHLRKGLVQISDHAVHLDSGDDLHRGLPNPGSGWIGASPVTSPSGSFSYSYEAMENTIFFIG